MEAGRCIPQPKDNPDNQPSRRDCITGCRFKKGGGARVFEKELKGGEGRSLARDESWVGEDPKSAKRGSVCLGERKISLAPFPARVRKHSGQNACRSRRGQRGERENRKKRERTDLRKYVEGRRSGLNFGGKNPENIKGPAASAGGRWDAFKRRGMG